MEKRNRYTAEFKTKVVLEVLREEQTVNEIAGVFRKRKMLISAGKNADRHLPVESSTRNSFHRLESVKNFV
ncbi:hypothetical protein EXW96_25795 [Paenibacillus sp. JMULE4]|nr:hypothetical protein [Paenibacillus sp. JMULE4]